MNNAPDLTDQPPRQRVFETVRRAVLDAIRTGELQPGDKLPSERALAEKYLVSRSAVREALRTLESSGVLRFEKGQFGGAFVREHSADGITQSFRDMILLGNMPFSELILVRRSLLQLAVELAAVRGLEADFALLDANIDATQRAVERGDPLATIEPVLQFNVLLGKASHNPVLMLVIDMLVQIMTELLRSLALPTRIDLVTPRRMIVAFLRDGRGAEARDLLMAHLAETSQYVLEHARLQEEAI
ncbi:FadR family transcriptional regulator [Novosphingobium lubricantis]|jgi:DNA-binding FadR family transcriptional regulator